MTFISLTATTVSTICPVFCTYDEHYSSHFPYGIGDHEIEISFHADKHFEYMDSAPEYSNINIVQIMVDGVHFIEIDELERITQNDDIINYLLQNLEEY